MSVPKSLDVWRRMIESGGAGEKVVSLAASAGVWEAVSLLGTKQRTSVPPARFPEGLFLAPEEEAAWCQVQPLVSILPRSAQVLFSWRCVARGLLASELHDVTEAAIRDVSDYEVDSVGWRSGIRRLVDDRLEAELESTENVAKSTHEPAGALIALKGFLIGLEASPNRRLLHLVASVVESRMVGATTPLDSWQAGLLAGVIAENAANLAIHEP